MLLAIINPANRRPNHAGCAHGQAECALLGLVAFYLSQMYDREVQAFLATVDNVYTPQPHMSLRKDS